MKRYFKSILGDVASITKGKHNWCLRLALADGCGDCKAFRSTFGLAYKEMERFSDCSDWREVTHV